MANNCDIHDSMYWRLKLSSLRLSPFSDLVTMENSIHQSRGWLAHLCLENSRDCVYTHINVHARIHARTHTRTHAHTHTHTKTQNVPLPFSLFICADLRSAVKLN